MNTILSGYELSPVQKRIWRLKGARYHRVSLQGTGVADIDEIRQCMLQLVLRHEILQFRFSAVEGVKYPLAVFSEGPLISLQEDSDEAPLVIQVQQFLPDVFHLSFAASPMYTDVYSLRMLAQDFSQCYHQVQDKLLQPEGISYTQFSSWLNELQKSPDEDALAFWAGIKAKAVPQKMSLEGRYEGSFSGSGRQGITLTKEEADACRQMALSQHVTVAEVLLGIFGLQQSRYANSHSGMVGYTAAERIAELASTLGPVSFTVPVYLDGDGLDTWSDYLQMLTKSRESSFEQQEYFITDEDRFFRLGFEYIALSDKELGAGFQWRKEELVYSQDEYFTLKLVVTDYDEQIKLDFHYDPAVYEEASVKWMLLTYQSTLHNICVEGTSLLSQLSTGDAGFQMQVNNLSSPFPETTITELFRRAVQRYPEHTAVIFNDTRITYREIDIASDHLADIFSSKYNIRPGARTGILLNRSEKMIIAILAVLKTGAAYVPIDPAYPAGRISYIIEDASLSLLVSQQYIMDEHPDIGVACFLLDDIPADSRSIIHHVDPEDVAYIIYTSGTTGNPKGVVVQHKSICNTLQWRCAYYDFNTADIILQVPSFAFDSSVEDIFCALLSGATLLLMEEQQKDDPVYLQSLLSTHGVTHFLAVPSFYKLVLEELHEYLNSLRVVTVAGEALTTAIKRLHFKRFPAVQLINEYGPTENAVCSTVAQIWNDSRQITIGKPITGVACYIYDQQGVLLPPGYTGELYLAGKGLASGYWKRPELTAEKFADNMYRTGDQGYWLPDGNIVFLGRGDQQVKIRGYRVEPAEVATVMEQLQGISMAFVKAFKDADHEIAGLAAYYTADKEYTEQGIEKHLLQHLPEYMIPRCYIRLDKFPLTPNGKLDYQGLADPLAYMEQQSRKIHVLPRNEKEHLLAGVWASVLNRGNISINDNFYSIGGDSIKAIQIAARVHAMGYRIEVKDIFRSPYIHALAELLQTRTEVIEQTALTGEVPLLPVQRYFFHTIHTNRHHYNQSVLLHMEGQTAAGVHQQVFAKLLEHHDMLRAVYEINGTQIIQRCTAPSSNFSIDHFYLAPEQIADTATALHASLSLEDGPLVKVAVFHSGEEERLLIIAHHLVTDGISWRIIAEDLQLLYRQAAQAEPLQLPLKTLSYRDFATRLNTWREQQPAHVSAYWQEVNKQVKKYNAWTDATPGRLSDRKEFSFEPAVVFVPGISVEHLLLSALALAMEQTFNGKQFPVMIENHGRDILEDTNVSRTVGWFTLLFPFILRAGSVQADMNAVVEKAAVPLDHVRPLILFNYLGEWTGSQLTDHSIGRQQSSRQELEYILDISCMLINGQLQISMGYDSRSISDTQAMQLRDLYKQQLAAYDAGNAAFTYSGLSDNEIDSLFE